MSMIDRNALEDLIGDLVQEGVIESDMDWQGFLDGIESTTPAPSLPHNWVRAAKKVVRTYRDGDLDPHNDSQAIHELALAIKGQSAPPPPVGEELTEKSRDFVELTKEQGPNLVPAWIWGCSLEIEAALAALAAHDAQAGETRATEWTGSELKELGKDGSILRNILPVWDGHSDKYAYTIVATVHPLPEPEPEEEKSSRTPEEREKFHQQLHAASEEVASWPESKRRAIRAAIEIPKQPDYLPKPELFVERVIEVKVPFDGDSKWLPVPHQRQQPLSECQETLRDMFGYYYRYLAKDGRTMECTAANGYTATEVK